MNALKNILAKHGNSFIKLGKQAISEEELSVLNTELKGLEQRHLSRSKANKIFIVLTTFILFLAWLFFDHEAIGTMVYLLMAVAAILIFLVFTHNLQQEKLALRITVSLMEDMDKEKARTILAKLLKNL